MGFKTWTLYNIKFSGSLNKAAKNFGLSNGTRNSNSTSNTVWNVPRSNVVVHTPRPLDTENPHS